MLFQFALGIFVILAFVACCVMIAGALYTILTIIEK